MGKGWISAKPARDFVPIKIGHHNVKQNEVGSLCGSLREPLGAVTGNSDLVALALEHEPNQLQGIKIVIDN